MQVKNHNPFLKLTSYYLKTTLQSWSFYIFSGLFILMWCFFIYIYPIIEKNMALLEIFRYKFIISFVILFLVIDVVVIASKIFTNSWYDGSEILIVSKPINRFNIIWSKLFTLLILILMLATSAMITSIFTQFTPYATDNVHVALIIGSFTTTVVVGFTFSSLTILFAIFLKPMMTTMLVVGLQMVLLIIQVVLNVVISSPGYELSSNYKIKMDNIAILSKPNSDNQVNYLQTAIMTKDGQPVTENTKFDGIALKHQHANLANFAQTVYQRVSNNPKRLAITYLDIEMQLDNLFMIYPKSYLDKHNYLRTNDSYGIFENIFNSKNESYYWNLNFNSLGMSKILASNNTAQIIQNPYKLTLVSRNNFKVVENKHEKPNVFHGVSNMNESQGKVGNFLNNLSFPTYELDSNNSFGLTQFNSVNEFANYYYNEQFSNLEKFKKVFLEKNQDESNLSGSSYYFSLLSSYLYDHQLLDLNRLKLYWNNNLLNYLQEWMMNFQYQTYLGLQDYYNNPQNYSWMTNEKLQNIYEVLNFNSSKLNNNYKYMIFIGSPEELKYSLDSSVSNYDNQWYFVSPQLFVMPEEFLETMTLVQLKQSVNPIYTIVFWMIFSAIVFWVSSSLYIKKDIA